MSAKGYISDTPLNSDFPTSKTPKKTSKKNTKDEACHFPHEEYTTSKGLESSALLCSALRFLLCTHKVSYFHRKFQDPPRGKGIISSQFPLYSDMSLHSTQLNSPIVFIQTSTRSAYIYVTMGKENMKRSAFCGGVGTEIAEYDIDLDNVFSFLIFLFS